MMKLLAISLTMLIISGCQSTFKKVDIEEITTNAAPSTLSTKHFLYDVQPQNKEETCVVHVEGYELLTKPLDLEQVSLTWDGECKNSKAFGVGKLTADYGNGPYDSILKIDKKGRTLAYYILPSELNNNVATYGAHSYDSDGMIEFNYYTREFININTKKPVVDGYFKSDIKNSSTTGTFIKYYGNEYNRFSGYFGQLFKGSIENYSSTNIKGWHYWGFYNLKNDKFEDYGISNQNNNVAHTKYKYGQIVEHVQLPQEYIDDLNSVTYHAQEDASTAMQHGTFAKNMFNKYNKDLATQKVSNKPKLAKETKPKNIEKKEASMSTGTGFFVSKSGHILTNYHVIKGSKDISIIFEDVSYSAKIIDTDPINDVALLKIKLDTSLLSLEVKHKTFKGEKAIAIGYPNISLQGFEEKATIGYINSLSGVMGDTRFLQISNPIQPGNSGGPLLNTKGEVIGIVTATLNQSAAIKTTGTIAQNVNYALKITYALPMLISNDVSYSNFEREKEIKDVDNIKASNNSLVLIVAK